MPESNAAVEFRDVSYRLPNGRAILDNLNLAAKTGEILIFLGRSGSGKTTALKLVNRLNEVTGGEVRVEQRSVREWDPVQLRRHIGYAIQEVGLLPHYTVERNIGLVPSIEGWPKEKVRGRAGELLKLVGLAPDIRTRYPHQLSGGQRQRVGVARALAADPPILLMDEPFGALDALTRADLQREFLELQRKLCKTVLFVTHDMREALMLGTRIALIEQGTLVSLTTRDKFLSSTDPLIKKYIEAFELSSVTSNGKDHGRPNEERT